MCMLFYNEWCTVDTVLCSCFHFVQSLRLIKIQTRVRLLGNFRGLFKKVVQFRKQPLRKLHKISQRRFTLFTELMLIGVVQGAGEAHCFLKPLLIMLSALCSLQGPSRKSKHEQKNNLYIYTNISLSQTIMEPESVFLFVYHFDRVYLGTIKGNLL